MAYKKALYLPDRDFLNFYMVDFQLFMTTPLKKSASFDFQTFIKSIGMCKTLLFHAEKLPLLTQL